MDGWMDGWMMGAKMGEEQMSHKAKSKMNWVPEEDSYSRKREHIKRCR